MSNILIGIIAILFVYLIEIVVCFVAIRLVNKVTNNWSYLFCPTGCPSNLLGF